MGDDQVEIPISGPVRACIRPPSSKSITNRALICAALAEGTSVLSRPLDSDDTRVMIECLRRLGIYITQDVDLDRIQIEGCGGDIPNAKAELFIGNSGTSVRFLTCLVATGQGEYVLDGQARMRQRPIQDLIDALNALGTNITSRRGSGCPPVLVRANRLRGGEVSIRGDVSSQFLSGLLMAAPYATSDTWIAVDGQLVSRPYVDMTIAVMRTFGGQVSEHEQTFHVPAGVPYIGREHEIEPDASAASYFWGAAAITGGQSKVLGLGRNSLQGDVRFCDLLVQMGCHLVEGEHCLTIQGADRLQGIDCNMNDISDTVQTLCAVALFANGPTTIRGVAHNRHKETDRIGNLAIELRKFGAEVEEREDGLRVHPPVAPRSAIINTYDDHRMAMSLALPGLRIPGVVIRDPGCTAKTYPDFFADLAKINDS